MKSNTKNSKEKTKNTILAIFFTCLFVAGIFVTGASWAQGERHRDSHPQTQAVQARPNLHEGCHHTFLVPAACSELVLGSDGIQEGLEMPVAVDPLRSWSVFPAAHALFATATKEVTSMFFGSHPFQHLMIPALPGDHTAVKDLQALAHAELMDKDDVNRRLAQQYESGWRELFSGPGPQDERMRKGWADLKPPVIRITPSAMESSQPNHRVVAAITGTQR